MVPTAPCLVAADGSGTYTTIQDAVDAASEGDLITVCPGYYGPVVVDDVGVTLQGYGADSTCIIGTTEDAAITIDGSIVPTIPPRFAAEISGFTVSGYTRAIRCAWSEANIHDLRIAGVSAGDTWSTAAYTDLCHVTWDRVAADHNASAFVIYNSGGAHMVRHSVFTTNSGTGFGSIDSTDDESASVDVTNNIFVTMAAGCRSTVSSATSRTMCSTSTTWDSRQMTVTAR